jgi:DNA-binding NtrC family response regulator
MQYEMYDNVHLLTPDAPMTAPTVILIIEDEEFLRSSLADYLEDHGYDVLSSPTAEDGLNQLENNDVELCIVDMRLPDMNGNEFILQAHSRKNFLKFIIFTGSVEYSLPESLQEIGLHSTDVLFKPLTDMSLMLEKIREACPAGDSA